MNAAMIPTRLPEPPPVAQAFDLELLDGDRIVGWIAPDRIAFVGFANEIEAAHAAHVAHRAIARRLAQRAGRRPVPIELDQLSIRREADDAIVYASGQEIARLVSPGADARAADSFAFELSLDPPRDEVSVRAKAHLAYRTLRRSGVRWSMWRVPVAAPAPAAPVVEVPREDSGDMRIESPIPGKYALATALSFFMLVIALVAPGALAVAFAGLGLAVLLVLRLTVLHAHWPVRSLARPAGFHRSFL